MIGPRRREDFDVLIQLRAVQPVMRHADEISEIDNRYRLNKKRRTLVRAALQELMASVDECLKVLQARYESDFALPKDIDPAEWEELKEEIQQIEMLLGGSLPKPPRWSELHRHLHFGMTGDLRDIVKHDWPQAKAGLSKGLYDENEPIPVEVEAQVRRFHPA
jgi:hypothetical protein